MGLIIRNKVEYGNIPFTATILYTKLSDVVTNLGV